MDSFARPSLVVEGGERKAFNQNQLQSPMHATLERQIKQSIKGSLSSFEQRQVTLNFGGAGLVPGKTVASPAHYSRRVGYSSSNTYQKFHLFLAFRYAIIW